jgi:DNA polymerase III subunit delta'
MTAPYPWLDSAWQKLGQAMREDTLAHAYLISGVAGLGKFALANAFANVVLCESGEGLEACGVCRSCMLIAAGNHPDLKILQLEEDKKSILIDQVRDLIAFYSLRPHYGSRKLALIYPAELMNANAANALLKLLEEPPAGALLLLLSHRPGQLTQTIVSRCQKLKLSPPDWGTCLAWLDSERAGDETVRPFGDQTLAGAPLEIRAQLSTGEAPPFDAIIASLGAIALDQESPFVNARDYAKNDVREFLDAIDVIVRALIATNFGQQLRHLHASQTTLRRLHEIANKLNSQRLFSFLDQIASARSVVLRSSGIRSAEVIENLFYCWAKVTQSET